MSDLFKILSISSFVMALSACGGGSSGSGDAQTGSFSLDVTDAPTTEFEKVLITFTGVTIKPVDGDAVVFDFESPKELDLLQLQGGVSAPLLEGVEIVAGDYEWIRLTLNEDELRAYKTGSDSEYKLFVPSGGQTGLKLVRGFTVTQGGENNFTIDFDVRKSIVNPKGASNGADYFLKPALRLVDNLEVGSLSGDVDYGSINQNTNLAACDYEGSVYIYEGENTTPVDLNVNLDNNPLMVVPVEKNLDTGLYDYTAAFLKAGDYTVSYSCQADDNEGTDAIEFIGTQNVTVVKEEETVADTIDGI